MVMIGNYDLIIVTHVQNCGSSFNIVRLFYNYRLYSVYSLLHTGVLAAMVFQYCLLALSLSLLLCQQPATGQGEFRVNANVELLNIEHGNYAQHYSNTGVLNVYLQECLLNSMATWLITLACWHTMTLTLVIIQRL